MNLQIKRLLKKLNQTKNLDDLVYRYKSNNPNEEFNTYDNALDLINKIKNDEIKLEEAKNDQRNFKSILSEINKGNNKKKIKGAKKRAIQY